VAKNSSAELGKKGSVRSYVPDSLDMSGPERFLSSEEKRKIELRKAESEGFEKGHTEGFSHGLAAGQKEISGRLARLDSIISEIDRLKARKLEELLPEIVELSLEISRKIVHRKIEQDREIIISVVSDAVGRLGREEKMTIRVNPADYETMISNLEVFRAETRLKDITIEPTESITPGGCYIEASSCEVDARIEEQIKEIRDAISAALDR